MVSLLFINIMKLIVEEEEEETKYRIWNGNKSKLKSNNFY